MERLVQVMPSGLLAAFGLPSHTAAKMLLPQATARQPLVDVGKVRAVHVIPSGLVAPIPALVVNDTARNRLLPYVMSNHEDDDGNVRCVQVMPSGLVAAMLVPCATAQNVLLPYAIALQVVLVGNVRDVQLTPSGLVAAALVPLPIATYVPLP
jgi:hypothetical protein